jgi:hypothetical protein
MGLLPDTPPPGMISIKSTVPVQEAVDRLVQLVESKGFTGFCRIDPAAGTMRSLLGAVTHGAAMT